MEIQIKKDTSFEKYIVKRSLDFDRPEPVLCRGDCEILHLKDLQMIEGQSGSRKTFLVSAMIAGLIGDNAEECLGFYSNKELAKVLLIDTEQSLGNVQRVARRTHKMANFQTDTDFSGFTVLSLRECTFKERLEVTKSAIEHFKPDVVFIDNAKDLLSDFNNIEESSNLVTTLMRLASSYNCAICAVIHQNFGTVKARGHFGSLLYEKVSLSLTLKAEEETTEVSFSKVRNTPPEKFAFCIEDKDDGWAVPVLTYLPEPTPTNNRLSKKFEGILNDGEFISHTELTQKLMNLLNIKESMAKRNIKNALTSKILVKNDFGLYGKKQAFNDEIEPPF